MFYLYSTILEYITKEKNTWKQQQTLLKYVGVHKEY